MSDNQRCDRCGNARHMLSWECKRDLHGRGDAFKTRCAACEEPIPSGAPRAGDKFGNLYCDSECMALGMQVLLLRADDERRRVANA